MKRAFIQARVGSRRFPGKVLAVIGGKPVIAHVIDRVASALSKEQIVVTTSTDKSDDALAERVQGFGIAVHRGPLENVMKRFQSCLEKYPCNWFFRVCADSPALDPELLSYALRFTDQQDVDVITNVFPRTFPRGQSVELIRASILAGIDAGCLPQDEQEHVTKHFYSYPGKFRILNFESEVNLSDTSFTVDTPEDIGRLSGIFEGVGMFPRFSVKTA